MPIFTAEIAGRPTVVFGALNRATALTFVNYTFIRSELQTLRTPAGAPLWDGQESISIRRASMEDEAVWERDLAEYIADGVYKSRDDAVENMGFTFLVDYLERDE